MSSTKFIVYTLNGMCCHTLHTLGGVEILIFFADWHKKTHAIVGEKCTVKIRERRQFISTSMLEQQSLQWNQRTIF